VIAVGRQVEATLATFTVASRHEHKTAARGAAPGESSGKSAYEPGGVR
jgi:hypothetical protein